MGTNAGRRSSKAWLRGATVGVAILAAASLASGAGLKTKSETVTVPGDGLAKATAKCAKGDKAVSGGFENPDLLFPTRGAFAFSSRRQGGRKWTSSADAATSGDATLTGFAYCSRNLTGIKTRSKTETLGTGPDTTTLTPKCKQGQRIVSGGYSADPDLLMYESRKRGARKWEVSAHNFADPGKLTAFAYCSKNIGKLKAKSGSTEVAPFPDTDSVSAACGPRQRLISGGFDNPDFGLDPSTEPQISPYNSIKDGKRTWTASGFGFSETGGTFTVYAYCEKK